MLGRNFVAGSRFSPAVEYPPTLINVFKIIVNDGP